MIRLTDINIGDEKVKITLECTVEQLLCETENVIFDFSESVKNAVQDFKNTAKGRCFYAAYACGRFDG